MSRSAAIVAGATSVGCVVGAMLWSHSQPSPEHQNSEPPEPANAVAAPAAPAVAASESAPETRPRPPDLAPSSDEASLLAKLHGLGMSDPELSLKLAREAIARFPNSPNAPEFEWNAVKALFNLHRIDEAKEEAREMLRRFPANHFSLDVDRHLLHPQPNQSVDP